MNNSPISQAMLMAAGLGTRLKPFTDHVTKALMPIMNIPVAQFSIDSLRLAGVQKIVANIHHQASQTEQQFLNLDRGETSLILSDESKQLLGSAGGIRHAIQHFGKDPFYLANADVLCDIDWVSLGREHRRLKESRGVVLTLALFPFSSQGGSYREITFDFQTRLIQGLGTLVQNRPFFIGAAVIEPEALEEVPGEGTAEFVPTILEPAIRSKKAGVYLAQGNWFDIGSPSLWLDTHLSMMSLLERGRFQNSYGHQWRKRIEAANVRLAEKTWASRNSSSKVNRSGWVGPCYWSGETSGDEIPPRKFGPSAVLYGNIPSNLPSLQLQGGIGMAGNWVNVP
jgi:NDP-sugar pyrophosphorylase family protein